MNNLTVVPTVYDHLDKITDIEKDCFSNPWSRASFEASLAADKLQTCLTALLDGEAAGYICIFHLFEEGELLNIAVSPKYRRLGIAQRLIDEMLTLLKTKNVERVTLEVRQSNASARSLYEKNGFLPIAVRKNYYTNPFEDGIVMEKRLQVET